MRYKMLRYSFTESALFDNKNGSLLTGISMPMHDSLYLALQNQTGPHLTIILREDAAYGILIDSFDATAQLRLFARQAALSIAHLWQMPEIVRQYLETGREDLRAKARKLSYAADAATYAAAGAAGAAYAAAAYAGAAYGAGAGGADAGAGAGAREQHKKKLISMLERIMCGAN